MYSVCTAVYPIPAAAFGRYRLQKCPMRFTLHVWENSENKKTNFNSRVTILSFLSPIKAYCSLPVLYSTLSAYTPTHGNSSAVIPGQATSPARPLDASIPASRPDSRRGTGFRFVSDQWECCRTGQVGLARHPLVLWFVSGCGVLQITLLRTCTCIHVHLC